MHEEKKLTELIELQRENIRITHENNNSLREENAELRDIIERQKQTIIQYNERDAKQNAKIELLKTAIKGDCRAGWENKFFKAIEENTKLQKQVDELTEEREKAYEIERANIQAEIAEAGASCHWCKQQAEKDTAKEILDGLAERKERVKSFYGVAESVGVDIAIRAVKEILKQKGVEVER